jgi:hypothetical protein
MIDSANHYSLLLLVTLLAVPRLSTALDFDMKRWMGDIFWPDHGDTLLQDVILPGSHDAGAYRILDTDSDIPQCGVVDLGSVPNWVLEQVINWEQEDQLGVNLVETQRTTIYEQLMLGIRYLDLRLGWYQAGQEIRLHHTLFMDVTFVEVLNEIFNFLKTYPTEVVIMKMKLQCGTPLADVEGLLTSTLDNVYGGSLKRTTMQSPLSQVKGLAFVIYDEGDAETASKIAAANDSSLRSISQESYYQINTCDAEGSNPEVGAIPWFGGPEDTCTVWPEYTQDQGTCERKLHWKPLWTVLSYPTGSLKLFPTPLES